MKVEMKSEMIVTPENAYESGVILSNAIGPWVPYSGGGGVLGFNLKGFARYFANGKRAASVITAPHWDWCDWESYMFMIGHVSGQTETLEQGKEMADWKLGIGPKPAWYEENS